MNEKYRRNETNGPNEGNEEGRRTGIKKGNRNRRREKERRRNKRTETNRSRDRRKENESRQVKIKGQHKGSMQTGKERYRRGKRAIQMGEDQGRLPRTGGDER